MRLATLLFGLPCVFLRKRNPCADIHDELVGKSDGDLVTLCNAEADCIALLLPYANGGDADAKGLFSCH